MIDLTNKVAVVTGGAKGIGKSVSKLLAKQGAIVHILDLDKENGELTSQEINNSKGKATFHHCDLTEHETIGNIFKQIYDQFGRLNLLVNNAAISHIGDVGNTTPDDMDRLFNVNVKSVYSCLHFGVQYMKKSGGGSIVNMASALSVVGVAERFAYSMSKGAVYCMTFSIAKDYLTDNIRCNAIGPGRVHTPFVDDYLKTNYPGQEAEMFEKLSKTNPIGRMGTPDEIAALIAYLCSDEASFTTGSFYTIDGGFTTLNS